jgi:integrase
MGFPAPEGGHLRYDLVRRRVWQRAINAAGLAPLTFHQLRHTAAAFMIHDGADPLRIKRRMGHEDVRTTFNTYGHLFPDREEELVAALDRRQKSAQIPEVDSLLTLPTSEAH